MDNIRWIAKSDFTEVKKFRACQLKRMLQLEAECRAGEKALHKGMHPEVAAVLAGKRLVLFGRLLQWAGVEDAGLVKEMAGGFRILGHAEPSGQYPVVYKPAALMEEDLKMLAPWLRSKVEAKHDVPDAEVANHLWDEAEQQATDGSGWLLGPYTAEELDAMYPDGWVPSRRFGVVQGEKTRAIDDPKASMVNATCGTSDKLVLQDIDVVCATAKAFMKELLDGYSRVAPHIQGKALDLKSAPSTELRAPFGRLWSGCWDW